VPGNGILGLQLPCRDGRFYSACKQKTRLNLTDCQHTATSFLAHEGKVQQTGHGCWFTVGNGIDSNYCICYNRRLGMCISPASTEDDSVCNGLGAVKPCRAPTPKRAAPQSADRRPLASNNCAANMPFKTVGVSLGYPGCPRNKPPSKHTETPNQSRLYHFPETNHPYASPHATHQSLRVSRPGQPTLARRYRYQQTRLPLPGALSIKRHHQRENQMLIRQYILG
jgi:hypothetical protein